MAPLEPNYEICGVSVGGTGAKALSEGVFNQQGQLTWTGTGSILGDGNAVFNNSGVFDMQNDATFGWTGSGTVVFNNSGTVIKSAGTGVSVLGNTAGFSLFNNVLSGVVQVQSGTVRFAGGGGSSGSFVTDPATALELTGGTFTLESAAMITGTNVAVDGATVSLLSTNLATTTLAVRSGVAQADTNLTVGRLNLTGGRLVRNSSLTVSNLTWWSNATIWGSGTLTIPVGGVVSVGGTGAKSLSDGVFNQGGQLTWTGTGPILGSSNAVFNNSGVFDMQNDATFGRTGVGTVVFNNSGTLVKSAGTGLSVLGDTPGFSLFTNLSNGLIEIQTGSAAAGDLVNLGVLNLSGSDLFLLGWSVSDGHYNLGGASSIIFGGSNHVLSAVSQIAGSGSLIFAGGASVLFGTNALTTSMLVTGGEVYFKAVASYGNVTAPLQISGGTVYLDSPVSLAQVNVTSGGLVARTNAAVGRLNLTGGRLVRNSSSLTITNLTWTNAATIWGSGTLTIPPGGVVSVGGTGAKALYDGVFNQGGQLTWTGTGPILGGSNAVFNNSGVFDMQNDATFDRTGVGTVVFNNSGTVLKSAGTGVSMLGNTAGFSLFTNALSGVVQVQSGTVRFAGGGGSSGSFASDPATALELTGGTFTLESTAMITGTNVAVDGATVSLLSTNLALATLTVRSGVAQANTNLTVGRLNLTGGTLVRNSSLTISNLTWTNIATIQGNGTLTIPPGGVASVGGSGSKGFVGGVFNQQGQLTWTGTGSILGSSSAVFNNSGVFDMQSDATFGRTGVGNVVFNNSGTVLKSAGAGVSVLGNTANLSLFTNALSGVVQVQSGTVRFAGGGGSSGSFVTDPATALEMTGGTFTLESAAMIAGTNVAVDGATVSLLSTNLAATTLTVRSGVAQADTNLTVGSLKLTGGRLVRSSSLTVSNLTWTNAATIWGSGTLTIPAGGVVSVGGAGSKALYDGVFNQGGQLTWTGTGPILGGSNAVFNNSGVFDMQSDATFGWTGNGTVVFNNSGTLVKSAGTGVSSFGGVPSTPFTNTGTLRLERGTLRINQNYSPGAGTSLHVVLGGAGAGTGFGQLHVTGAAALAGTLRVSVTNGFQPAVGQQFGIGAFGSRTGVFNLGSGFHQANGVVMVPRYGVTNLTLVTADEPVISQLVQTNGQLNLGVNTTAGFLYALEFTDSLTPATWQFLTNFTGDGTFWPMVDPSISVQQRYYHMRIE